MGVLGYTKYIHESPTDTLKAYSLCKCYYSFESMGAYHLHEIPRKQMNYNNSKYSIRNFRGTSGGAPLSPSEQNVGKFRTSLLSTKVARHCK